MSEMIIPSAILTTIQWSAKRKVGSFTDRLIHSHVTTFASRDDACELSYVLPSQEK